MRVAPKVWAGVLVWAGYVAIIAIVTLLGGVKYTGLTASTGNLLLAGVLPLAVGAAYLVIVASLLGWWRPALRDRQRSHHVWPVIAPILLLVVAIASLFATDWGEIGIDFLLAALALGVLVGFNEEFVTRGLLVVGLRGRFAEVWVWLISSALFGLMHGVNFILGQPIGPTLRQMAVAFAAGTGFYILRRVTSSLVWAMVLHGLFDMANFLVSYASGSALGTLAAIVNQLAVLLCLVFVAFIIRGAHERLTAPAPEHART
jgi:membrane protease YdiL (CAAX protease family)